MTLILCRSDSLHTIEPWTVQVLFLPEIRTPQVTARLSAEGYSRNLGALQGLQDHLNALSQGEHFAVNIEERGPLDSVSPYGDQWWCGMDDVAQWIDPNASVVLVSYEIDDDSQKLSLNGLGGLGYYNNGIAYGAVPAWDGEQLYILDMWGLDPYVHEMLHGVCGYLASKGVPMPELHAPSEVRVRRRAGEGLVPRHPVWDRRLPLRGCAHQRFTHPCQRTTDRLHRRSLECGEPALGATMTLSGTSG